MKDEGRQGLRRVLFVASSFILHPHPELKAMSRIGKKPITIPKGVTITIQERELEVKGPKGVLKTPIPQGIAFKARRGSIAGRARNLTNRLRCTVWRGPWPIARFVGVTEGFSKQMDVVGVGYKADVQARKNCVLARLLAPHRVFPARRHRGQG